MEDFICPIVVLLMRLNALFSGSKKVLFLTAGPFAIVTIIGGLEIGLYLINLPSKAPSL